MYHPAGQYNTPTTSLQKSKSPSNKGPECDTKQSDGQALVMLELWENAEYPFITIAYRPTDPD